MTTWIFIVVVAIFILIVMAKIQDGTNRERKTQESEKVNSETDYERKLKEICDTIVDRESEAVASVHINVVGLRYRGYKARIAATELIEGEELFLDEEPYNKYDKNAIKITTLDDVCIGYLPREEAAQIKPFLMYVVKCRAFYVGYEYYPEITIEVKFREPEEWDKESLESEFYHYNFPNGQNDLNFQSRQNKEKLSFDNVRDKYKYAAELVQQREFDKALPLLMDCLNESYLIQAVPLKICQCYSVLHQKAMLEMFVNSIIDEEWITEYSRNKMKDYVRYCK